MNATTSIEASSFLGIILLLCFKILKIIKQRESECGCAIPCCAQKQRCKFGCMTSPNENVSEEDEEDYDDSNNSSRRTKHSNHLVSHMLSSSDSINNV